MKAQQEIKFTTTPSKTLLTSGKTLYQGQLRHNRVLDANETRQRFAEYLRVPEPQANLYLDSLGLFIRDAVAQGHRVDFGPFSVGLKLRGSFPAANAPFDAVANAVGVELMPSAAIKRAASALKPVNATEDASCRIYAILQTEPFEAYDTIATTGTRKLCISGTCMAVDASAADEGTWIENDAGERLLTGTVSESDPCRIVATFSGPVEPGVHWLVVGSHGTAEGHRLRARRRITACRI